MSFPSEWPRRLILGWSPSGVCVECGEGRRPVVERSGDYGQHYPNFRKAASLIDELGFSRTELRSLGASGWAKWKANGVKGPPPEMLELCERIESELGGYAECAIGVASGEQRMTGYACACPTTDAPTRPAVILDPFCGTGTVPAVAHALGRHGIGIDLSADYLRLAEWRCNDPALRAKVLGVDKPKPPITGQTTLFDEVA